MREVFECVVLQVPGQAEWGDIDVGDRIELHSWNELIEASAAGRAVHTVHAASMKNSPSSSRATQAGSAMRANTNTDEDTTGLIASSALALQRYDACLILVEPVGLPWVRMALARARPLLRTPILALALNVKAPAMADLLGLGLSDFVRMPVYPEELRARLMHQCLPAAHSPMSLREPSVIYGAAPSYTVASRVSRPRNRKAASRPSVNLALYDLDEPFRQAKARVVSGFERAYLSHVLARHEGNVAQAARASRKHRRAFWALLNKYAISARDYRSGSLPGR